MMSIDFSDPRVLAAAAVGAIVVILVLLIVRKGRPFAQGHVFRASRLAAGNHLFPTQVQITPAAVVRYTPQWLGHVEQSIHIAHVSSVRIDTNLMFSNVFIETSGGTNPVACHGHRKRDAEMMKRLIEQYQSGYYRQPPGASLSAAPPAADN
jgi:hypothetical protein